MDFKSEMREVLEKLVEFPNYARMSKREYFEEDRNNAIEEALSSLLALIEKRMPRKKKKQNL